MAWHGMIFIDLETKSLWTMQMPLSKHKPIVTRKRYQASWGIVMKLGNSVIVCAKSRGTMGLSYRGSSTNMAFVSSHFISRLSHSCSSSSKTVAASRLVGWLQLVVAQKQSYHIWFIYSRSISYINPLPAPCPYMHAFRRIYGAGYPDPFIP